MKTKKIKFYPKSHRYKIGRKELISVTTFISQFFKPFNAKEIARKLAKFPVNRANKRGVRFWLKEWKEAGEHGTRVHQYLQDWIEGKDTNITDSRDLSKTANGISWMVMNFNSEEYTRLRTEEIVYDEKLGVAGTIDLIKVNDDNSITLIDWKTNKKIDQKGYTGEKAKEPVNHLVDCNFWKYTLQLSLYAYILERQGYPIKDLKIVHLKEDEAKEYKVPYLKKEIKEMIEHGKETN